MGWTYLDIGLNEFEGLGVLHSDVEAHITPIWYDLQFGFTMPYKRVLQSVQIR